MQESPSTKQGPEPLLPLLPSKHVTAGRHQALLASPAAPTRVSTDFKEQLRAMPVPSSVTLEAGWEDVMGTKAVQEPRAQGGA